MNAPLPELFSMIERLVGIPSISSSDPQLDQSNLEVINELANWAESLGFKVRITPLKDGKANLIATLGNIDDPSGLVLSGHTDTVPFDHNRWTSDPFQLNQRDQRLYGLGTADMKGFFAIVLEAVRQFPERKFAHPLVLVATADEESSMSGAKFLAEQSTPLGRYAVIGEPTQLKPVRMHKGVMMESIVICGKSGHSSNPALGASALEGMHNVISEILAWRKQLQKEYRHELFEVAVPTLNLGSIHGGDAPNRICGHCKTLIDIRPLPGMEIPALREELHSRLVAALDRNPDLQLEFSPVFEGLPAFETPADSELVRGCESLSGEQSGAVAFGTEAPYFTRLGMQTVVMGPGSIDQAHQPDEYLALDQIQPAINLISQLIGRYCREPD